MPVIDLPLAPSVNQLWRSGRGRVFRSSAYDAWRKEAGWELQVQKPGVEGAVEVVISAGKPTVAVAMATISR
jgi:Holliday junction resolvase RusA-like endonuclease